MPPERAVLPWQLLALFLGLGLFLWPALMPLLELLEQPRAWLVWTEWDRLVVPIFNTLIVIAGSAAFAILLGGIAALLLTRGDVPLRRAWMLLLGLALFVPLPLLTSGWYLIAQFFGLPLPALWPLPGRILGAALLHGLVALPWVTLILGLGLGWVEPELEEEALLYAPFRIVLRRVILPRCRPFLGMAALLAAWPTWHEIAVTDFFKVNTIAQEIYIQINDGRAEDASRALAVVAPGCILLLALTWIALRAWRFNCPPRWPTSQQRPLAMGSHEGLGRWRWPSAAFLLLLTALVLLIPLAGLVAKAGMRSLPGKPPAWSAYHLADQLMRLFQEIPDTLLQSVMLVLATGLIISALVFFGVCLARCSFHGESAIWWLSALLASLPGPVVGLGLLTVIQQLLHMPGSSIWSAWLYDRPSPLPNVWAALLRYFPLAWAMMWPIARMIPPAWDELAYLDGAGPWRRARAIYLPTLWTPVLWIGLAVGVLSLGEISAGKLVTTPGFLPLSQLIFQQLHAGADAEVAALSLALLLMGLLGGGALLAWRPWRRFRQGTAIGRHESFSRQV